MMLSRKVWLTALMLLLLVPLAVSAQVKVPAGTEVKVAFKQDVSSKHVAPGDEVEIVLTAPLELGGVVLVKAGATGTAKVKSVKSAGKPGKGGAITLELVGITAKGNYQSVNDQQLLLETEKGALEAKGKGKWWAWIPPLFILVKGGEAMFPADHPFTAKVKQDIFIIPAG